MASENIHLVVQIINTSSGPYLFVHPMQVAKAPRGLKGGVNDRLAGAYQEVLTTCKTNAYLFKISDSE